MLKLKKPLVIFEMANNHQGKVSHGKKIIHKMKEASEGFNFDFAVKFQYRNLETFIHPDYKDRMDLHFVKRFSETRLNESEFLELKNEVEKVGFKTICTPFDEESVDKIVKHKFDYIKIASCSVTDWPLLEKIATVNLPIISSSGGAEIQDVDKLVSFFTHKNKEFALLHCVGIYPTPDNLLTMNRINWFKNRYKNITTGFSTHENPGNLFPGVIAVAKGGMIFEKHVGVETNKIKLNKYSCNPEQIKKWLEALNNAFIMCGPKNNKEHKVSNQEKTSLNDLKRGVFAKKNINKDEIFTKDDVFYAMPNSENQMTSEFISKHNKEFIALKNYEKNEAINEFKIGEIDIRGKISSIIHTVKSQLNQSRIEINNNTKIELSHHYGIDNFDKYGAVIADAINREYCKKLIIQIPGQSHPKHYHKKKEETFQVLWGSMELIVDNNEIKLKAGDIVTVEREQIHQFSTENGVIFEEVSTTHFTDDSYYIDEDVQEKRKTNLKEWWLSI